MKINLANIKKAKKILDKSDCVAVPTETVYGLAGNAYSDRACRKIFKLKNRPKYNPLIVHYYNLENLKKDCELNRNFFKLYKKLSPGPITYVLNLKKDSKISKLVTNNQNSLAVRFPKHPIIKYLLKKLEYPLAAPSANISSRLSSVSPSDVKEDFGKKIKYILNGGRSTIGVESTIIDLRKKPKILRLGGLEVKNIKKIINQKIIDNTNPKRISSPGQTKLHYSPGMPVRLNATRSRNNEAFVILKKAKKTKKNYFFLSKKGDLKEAAKNLYSVLRKIKKSKFNYIAVKKIPNYGLGKTINDRLKRASKY